MEQTCAMCGARSAQKVSCAPGKRGTRVPFGLEFHILAVEPKTGLDAPNCPVCGTPRGGFHHVDCQVDECPACQGAAWRCSCVGDRRQLVQARP